LYVLLTELFQLQSHRAVLAGCVPRFRPPALSYTHFRRRRGAPGDDVEISFLESTTTNRKDTGDLTDATVTVGEPYNTTPSIVEP